MNPNIQFSSNDPIANENLTVFYDAKGQVMAGGNHSISVDLTNCGDERGTANVHLYWDEPNLGTPSAFRRNIASELALPAAATVEPQSSMTLALEWAPTVATIGTPAAVHGCMFAQIECEANFPTYGGEFAAENWDPTYLRNAQQNLYFVNMPQGTSNLNFAFGAGHTQQTSFTTTVRVNTDSLDIAQLAAKLQRLKCNGAPPSIGSCTLVLDAAVIEGAECIVAPEQSLGGVLPLRLGNTGVVTDAVADDLAINNPAPCHTLTLVPNMLRQVMVSIPIPPGATQNSVYVASVIHETRRRYVRTQPITLGSAIVAVRIV